MNFQYVSILGKLKLTALFCHHLATTRRDSWISVDELRCLSFGGVRSKAAVTLTVVVLVVYQRCIFIELKR